jgi:hypothetical protein
MIQVKSLKKSLECGNMMRKKDSLRLLRNMEKTGKKFQIMLVLDQGNYVHPIIKHYKTR